jgi:SAM-dependent methyltransferase
MEHVNRNIENWRTMYAEGKNDLLYPNDVLVRIGARLFNSKTDKRILDFGFGTGANLIHFAKQGYSMYGVEISEDAIRKTKERLPLKADLTLMGSDGLLPYADAHFDIIVAWQVLCYNDWNSLSSIVLELERVLRPGGLMLSTMIAPGDISQVQADALGDCLYRSHVSGQEGCILVIPEKKDLPLCFPGRKLEIGEFGYTWAGMTARHWIVLYRKD